MYIRVLDPHEVDEAEWRDNAGTTRATPARLDGLSVLLVEDNADRREALSIVLQIAGVKVEAVGSVHDALSAFNGYRPDVLVSDIGMPDEDGYALIRHVRAREVNRGGNTPAIALTGYVSSEDRARLLAAGFQAHVHKPVDPRHPRPQDPPRLEVVTGAREEVTRCQSAERAPDAMPGESLPPRTA